MQCVLAVIADDFGIHSQSLHDYICALFCNQTVKAHCCLHQKVNNVRINHEHNYAICDSNPISETTTNKAEATVRVANRATYHHKEPVDEVQYEKNEWHQSIHLQSDIELSLIVEAEEMIHALQIKEPIHWY